MGRRTTTRGVVIPTRREYKKYLMAIRYLFLIEWSFDHIVYMGLTLSARTASVATDWPSTIKPRQDILKRLRGLLFPVEGSLAGPHTQR